MLTFENGVIRLGDRKHSRCSQIALGSGSGEIRRDTMDARSGQGRIPAGWEDADISAPSNC
jgi:hypothetical protein